jgi:hypothetical protein
LDEERFRGSKEFGSESKSANLEGEAHQTREEGTSLLPK